MNLLKNVCLASLISILMVGVSTNVIAKGNIGEACKHDKYCKSGNCSKGTCLGTGKKPFS